MIDLKEGATFISDDLLILLLDILDLPNTDCNWFSWLAAFDVVQSLHSSLALMETMMVRMNVMMMVFVVMVVVKMMGVDLDEGSKSIDGVSRNCNNLSRLHNLSRQLEEPKI